MSYTGDNTFQVGVWRLKIYLDFTSHLPSFYLYCSHLRIRSYQSWKLLYSYYPYILPCKVSSYDLNKMCYKIVTKTERSKCDRFSSCAMVSKRKMVEIYVVISGFRWFIPWVCITSLFLLMYAKTCQTYNVILNRLF